jgi:hypothetical protein
VRRIPPLWYFHFFGAKKGGAAGEREKDEGKNTKAAECAALQNGLPARPSPLL